MQNDFLAMINLLIHHTYHSIQDFAAIAAAHYFNFVSYYCFIIIQVQWDQKVKKVKKNPY